MFDLKNDNQLMSMVAGLAAGAILLTGAAGVAAAEIREAPAASMGASADLLPDRKAERAEKQRAERKRAARKRAARERAERERAAEQRAASTTGPVQGVPRATLDAIAACESGGNPAAVNPAGYYGKYQFSIGTWQAVGGTGNPAEASEAEQDLRAAILYNRSGPGQWPVCGV